jgi:Gas vesicle protein G
VLTEFIGWVLNTLTTAAEAEMNDDTALREQLLDAEMRREMGEISGQEFAALEADLLARIREIKERREGGSGPLSMGSQPIEATGDSRFQIEASVSGDFHDPASAPHTTIVETEPGRGEQIAVLDMEAGQAESRPDASLPLGYRPAKRRRRSSPARRKLRTS